MDTLWRRYSQGRSMPNPMGTLHGGVLCDLADAAMGMAFVTTLAPEESFTTMELSVKFLSTRVAHRAPR